MTSLFSFATRSHVCRQVLDTLQVERERGITVKAQHASMAYKGLLLQLIDTVGYRIYVAFMWG